MTTHFPSKLAPCDM